MTRRFETGEVVELNSGGPKMTVSDPLHADENVIDVHWFVDGMLQRDAFHKDCLFSPAQRRTSRWDHDGDYSFVASQATMMESTK